MESINIMQCLRVHLMHKSHIKSVERPSLTEMLNIAYNQRLIMNELAIVYQLYLNI